MLHYITYEQSPVKSSAAANWGTFELAGRALHAVQQDV